MVVPVSKPTVSSGELKYRKELFPDVKEITKNKNLVCTSCSRPVKDLITKGKPISHPFLETLLCEKCYSFYGDGEFSVDEDGSDKYCRWCGQGGTLFLCSKCTAGFCKKCVKRNLPRSALNEIEDDDWECYCCNTQPLYELRAHCWAAKQYAEDLKEVKDKSSSKSKKSKDNKRSRQSSIDEDDEEKKPQSKKRKNKESSSDEAANDDEDRSSKKRHKNDSRRSDRKSDRKNENGDTEKERPSKDRKSRSNKEDEVNENTDDESAISSKLTTDYKKKINDFITDYALITKDCHKKILLFKTKKTNLNAVEDVKNLHSSIKEVINSYFTAGKQVLKVFDEHTEAFVNELDGKKDKNGTKKTDSSEIEINTVENNRDVLDASEPEKEKSVEPKTEKVTTDHGEKTDDKPLETNESDRKLDSEKLCSGSGDASKIDKELEDGLDKNPDNPSTQAGVKEDTTPEEKNSKSSDVSSSEPSNKDQCESSKS